MRALIRSTNKAVRITGLSGVGKTRIVQALFDETVGTDALDRTVAIYVDTGSEPVPSATAMLDKLIAEDRRAIMILDNCPSELHASLASKVSAAGKEVSLITIEYDIRDDKPQTTEVIHIETDGPEVAEQLLIRRFPSIGQNNARRIAEFADGNARVALAIAERVEEGESLALLSDAQLFNRLFEQRNHPDGHLREQAEILSLVYSFSVSSPDAATDELEILGALSGYPKIQLFKAATKLMERHVVQKRSHWRAILPHAIANKLAASALNSIPVDQLRATFEAPERPRLLMSFAHRLGLLHDHAVAKEIVKAWLHPEGLLGQIVNLDDVSTRILNYVAPVAPGALLERIEEMLVTSNFEHIKSRYNPQRTAIIKLLQLLAYESKYFERCIKLLICIADQESASNNYDSARNKIKRFFQPYLSSTHASLDQRVAIINECIGSSMAGHRGLGLEMLETALGGPPWTGFGINEFGARPRDYGFRPGNDELVAWLITFIDILVRLGTSGVPGLEDDARRILADKFRWIWRHGGIRSKLIDAARKLHAHRPWGEGWKAVRSTIYFFHTKRKDNEDVEPLPEILVTLERELEPNDLVPAVMAYVLSKGRDFWALDADYEHQGPNKFSEIRKILGTKAFKLGHEFAVSPHGLDELCPNLFLRDGMPYRVEFGKGLANGASDLRIYWQQLVIQLDLQHKSQSDVSVIRGFIEETNSIDSALAQELLDQCAQHSELRFELVNLHSWQEFTEIDLDRCMSLLDDSDIRPHMYGAILWGEQFSNLPESRVLELAQKLLSKPNGDEVVLEALSMKLADKGDAADTLGLALRTIGLSAAIQRFRRDHNDPGGYLDYAMERVIDATLRFDGNEAEKLEWLNTIFAVVDEHFGYIYSFEDAIGITAAWMPKEFLSRIFDGTEDQQQRRLHFINHDDSHQSPIAKIDVDILIEWCGTTKDPQVWASVASGINLWSKDGEQSPICLQDDALRFLEASPDPGAILEIFAEHVAPSSWSGSRANEMQPRVEAIGQLVTHERADISKSARAVYEKLTNWVEKEKERERLEDEELEQRFE
ncbi:hypothetical protein JEQ07_25230 [Serratia proteamaculans]|uniref:ATP-binding protein n=2 Tax=Serratia proteamaculans TaxID=28151 RepID=A0ABS0TZ74_SERPR|nr:hypothetical protein [Serratia proteamaculans]